MRGTEEKFSNAKNFPPKSEAPKKKSQINCQKHLSSHNFSPPTFALCPKLITAPEVLPPPPKKNSQIVKLPAKIEELIIFHLRLLPPVQNTSQDPKVLPPPLQPRPQKWPTCQEMKTKRWARKRTLTMMDWKGMK
jgi:hypothetical protein